MKKIAFMTLPWQLFAVALVLFLNSCGNKNESANSKVSGSGYILASSLALLGEIDNSTVDQKAIRALHRVSQEETLEATVNDTKVLCCCPCYQTFGIDEISAVQPSDETRIKNDTTLIDAVYTTKGDSTGHCPCPSAMEIIAKNVQRMTAALDGQEVAPKDQTGKMEGWTVFKIDEKRLTPGKHILRIQGNFFDEETRKYEIPFFIETGKPYLLNK